MKQDRAQLESRLEKIIGLNQGIFETLMGCKTKEQLIALSGYIEGSLYVQTQVEHILNLEQNEYIDYLKLWKDYSEKVNEFYNDEFYQDKQKELFGDE